MPELRKSKTHSSPASPRTCPQCGSSRLRPSKIRGIKESWQNHINGVTPIRCRDCRHRFLSSSTRKPVIRSKVRVASILLLILAFAGIGIFVFTDLLRQNPPNDQTANLGSAKTSRISPEVAKWLEALRTAQPEESDDGAENDLSRQAGFLEPDGPKIPKELMGQPLTYVEWYLAKHGIKYQTFMFGPTFDQPPFKVFQMNPKAGQYIPPDTTVTLYAYQNPQFRQTKWQQKIPSVAGLPLDEAEKRLRKLGFQPVLISVPTAEPAMDYVVRSQSLRPGAMAWPTTQVHLQVNRLVKRPKAETASAPSGQ